MIFVFLPPHQTICSNRCYFEKLVKQLYRSILPVKKNIMAALSIVEVKFIRLPPSILAKKLLLKPVDEMGNQFSKNMDMISHSCFRDIRRAYFSMTDTIQIPKFDEKVSAEMSFSKNMILTY